MYQTSNPALLSASNKTPLQTDTDTMNTMINHRNEHGKNNSARPCPPLSQAPHGACHGHPLSRHSATTSCDYCTSSPGNQGCRHQPHLQPPFYWQLFTGRDRRRSRPLLGMFYKQQIPHNWRLGLFPPVSVKRPTTQPRF